MDDPLASHLIMGTPWLFGLMLGFVLGAVSPAICVPSMLDLQKKGYGVGQGIPTLVIAASSTDDVLAITAFSALLSLTFASGEIWFTLLRPFIDLTIGVIYGLFSGFLMHFLPSSDSRYVSLFRVALLINFGLLSMFGSSQIGIDGAGAIGCLVSALVANQGWQKGQIADNCKRKVEDVFSIIWFLFQPFLFGLIGAELDLTNDFKWEYLGLGLAVLAIGLIFRTLVAAFVLFNCKLLIKEKIFVALAWLPKATVQAALGPVVFDTVLKNNLGIKYLKIGIQILTVAILSILVTAPMGALLIKITGPLLLRKSSSPQERRCGEDSLLQDKP